LLGLVCFVTMRALPLLDLIEIQWVDTDSLLLLLLLVACAIPVSADSFTFRTKKLAFFGCSTMILFNHPQYEEPVTALSVMTRSSLEERIVMVGKELWMLGEATTRPLNQGNAYDKIKNR
jgi:hypothetical protein